MSAPALSRPQPGVDYPGRTLGIVGLVLAFLLPLIGLIVSVVAYSQGKKAGVKNSLAFAGIIVGAVLVVIGLVYSIVMLAAVASGGMY